MEETLAEMRARPVGWRIDQLDAVAAAFPAMKRSQVGSHVTYRHPRVATICTVPAARPIKRRHVTMFVSFIDAAIAAGGAPADG